MGVYGESREFQMIVIVFISLRMSSLGQRVICIYIRACYYVSSTSLTKGEVHPDWLTAQHQAAIATRSGENTQITEFFLPYNPIHSTQKFYHGL